LQDVDQARERIQEDALDVQVREDWHNPGDLHATPSEFFILLLHGWPGGSHHGRNRRRLAAFARMDRVSGLGHALDEYHGAHDTEALLTYCNCFFFGA